MDEQMGPSNPSGSLGASTGVTPPSVPASPVFPPTQTTSPIGLPSEPPIQVPAAPIPPVSPPAPATQPQETISLRYVGFGRRFVALLIDLIILTVVGTLLFGGLVLVFVGDLQKLGEGGLVGLSFVSNLVMTLINWIYFVGFLASQGATPGKMALGIKVVTVNGEPVSIGRAILREIIGKIIAVLLLGLGYLWVIWDEKKQGWHDKIAGTVVVYK